RSQVSERWKHRYLNFAVVVPGILEGPGELLHVRDRLQVVKVHFPVAGNQRHSAWRLRVHDNTSSPGRDLPSRYSRLAPPPVDIWLKSSSANPCCRTAAAESPPPTTEKPDISVRAFATARVPAANGSI